MLKTDVFYLRYDYSVFGHIFVVFLSLYGYYKIEKMLRKRSLLDKISPFDVLKRFFTVYIIEDRNRKIIKRVSKKVREVEKKLGSNIFPKNLR